MLFKAKSRHAATSKEQSGEALTIFDDSENEVSRQVGQRCHGEYPVERISIPNG